MGFVAMTRSCSILVAILLVVIHAIVVRVRARAPDNSPPNRAYPVVFLLLVVRVHKKSGVGGGYFECVPLLRFQLGGFHSHAMGQVNHSMRHSRFALGKE